MRPLDLFGLSVRSLGQHGFRSLLTVLGVVFGVGALVSMHAITEGARAKSLESLNTLGIDNVVIQSVKPSESGKKKDEQSHGPFGYGLDEKDRRRFQTFDNVRRVVAVRDLRKDVFAQDRKTGLQVLATETAFLASSRSTVLAGRFLADLDAIQFNKVCVLGRQAAFTLFRSEAPLGERVRIGANWYRVAGVIETPAALKIGAKGSLANTVFIPYETARTLYGFTSLKSGGGTYESVRVVYDALLVQVKDLESLRATADRVRACLGATHRKTDYEVVVPYDLLAQSEKAQRIFAVVMGAIAGISLLVGAIGVTNIMLANVYERTREIGTCLALGAKRREILGQFLVESSALTLAGGVLGLCVGAGLAYSVTRWAGWETRVTPFSVVGGLVLSAGVGILAGTYPAWHASRLAPAEALRHE